MIRNLTKKSILSRNPVVALAMLERGRGMIGRSFTDFDAMVFHDCSCIHTMFMTTNIDVLFIDAHNRICGLRESLVPWKPFVRSSGAVAVIELPPGAISASSTEVGDTIDLNAELTAEEQKKSSKIIAAPQAVATLKTGLQK